MSALLALVVASSTPALEQALQRAVTRSPAKVELVSWDAPQRCRGTFEPAPFESSGRVAVRVRGKGCEAWGWARVRVLVPIATLTRDVKADEPLATAIVLEDAEARGVSALPAGAVATRGLKRGARLAAADFRTGPRPGTPLTVRVVLGGLSLEQRGTASSCSGQSEGGCATLPSGKRVAGVFEDGVLIVGGAP